MATSLPRRRRRGALERPVSARIYRAAWALVSVPLLVAAFTGGRPDALPPPPLDPSFDQTIATDFASELARRFPDRSPGSTGAREATGWVAGRLRESRLKPERQTFTAELPGMGEEELVNLVAVAPGRSPETIVVSAHRDNLPRSPGANDNASGTAALLELARDVRTAPPAHTLVFLSTDGGAYGGVGAAAFSQSPQLLKRLVGRGASIVAVVNLDALAGGAPPRLVFSGDTARSPDAALVATADANLLANTGSRAVRAHAVAQLVDLAFPFTLHEQGPFVARGTPAITMTTGGERPARADEDTLDKVDADQLGALGRTAQALLTSVDQSADVARGTESYLYFGSWFLRGWTIQFIFLVALLPFLAATVDLFARCRRRHVSLRPALRSFVSRLGVWAWAAALFALFAALGLLADAPARPLNPESDVAQDWPAAALLALFALSSAGWLVTRSARAPTRRPERQDELGGHLAAMLVLAVVALVVAAANPYALLFVLPSLHAWLWLPHLSERHVAARAALYATGLAGPLLLLLSFALRFELGLDALWYVAALTAVGYVPLPLLAATLVWTAAAGQVAAVAFRRYAPYPSLAERRGRGPIRELIRRVVLSSRRRRSGEREAEAQIRALRE